MSDRRAQFFFLMAVVCAALLPLAEHRFRTLTAGVGVVYFLLGCASWLDHRGRR